MLQGVLSCVVRQNDLVETQRAECDGEMSDGQFSPPCLPLWWCFAVLLVSGTQRGTFFDLMSFL